MTVSPRPKSSVRPLADRKLRPIANFDQTTVLYYSIDTNLVAGCFKDTTGTRMRPSVIRYSSLCKTTVASLGWVTPKEATEGVTPLFFPEKPGAVTIAVAFYCFRSGVTPSRVSSHTFFYLSDLVSPLFFVNLSTKKIFPSGVTPPPGGRHPGRPP